MARGHFPASLPRYGADRDLIATWHMFTRDTPYADLGGQYFIERTGHARQTRRLISQLNQLGYHVTLQTPATT
jgi:hypothetical protein